jgi:hypothetical protein
MWRHRAAVHEVVRFLAIESERSSASPFFERAERY